MRITPDPVPDMWSEPGNRVEASWPRGTELDSAAFSTMGTPPPFAVCCLTRAIAIRDVESGAHLTRMGRLCALLASNLGLEQEHCDAVGIASQLHDVGKLALPDTVLRKSGRLTSDDRRIIRRHARLGRDILVDSGDPLLDLAAAIAWTHHECFDGSGYPRGLVDAEIPLEGRIVAVADFFDAMTTGRIYRPSYPVDLTIDFLRSARKTHFDPTIVDCFTECLDEILEINPPLGGAKANRSHRDEATGARVIPTDRDYVLSSPA